MSKETKETKPVVRRGEIEPRRFPDIESVFDDWLDNFWARPFSRMWRPGFSRLRPVSLEAPAVDIYEEKDDLIVKAEIPGLTKDEIDVSLEGTTLTIRGEKKREEEIKDENYYRCERTFGSFSRMVELPADVKTDKVNATFKNGVLEVRLPKSEEAKKSVVKVKVA